MIATNVYYQFTGNIKKIPSNWWDVGNRTSCLPQLNGLTIELLALYCMYTYCNIRRFSLIHWYKCNDNTVGFLTFFVYVNDPWWKKKSNPDSFLRANMIQLCWFLYLVSFPRNKYPEIVFSFIWGFFLIGIATTIFIFSYGGFLWPSIQYSIWFIGNV